ncbi:lasso RiPP family leader peptide-containing protein [Streptomyces sp. NPDC059788]
MYEPPAVEDIGDFAELTLGSNVGTFFEGGYAPWYWQVPPAG